MRRPTGLRLLVVAALLLQWTDALPLPEKGRSAPLKRLAFGSCNHHDDPQPFWRDVAAANPDAFLWLGDIMYADAKVIWKWRIPANSTLLRALFDAQKAVPEYADFASRVPITGIVDDHDLGQNDADKTWDRGVVATAHQALFDFLDEPADSTRRKRAAQAADGIGGFYTYFMLGEAPRRVRLILLDARSFRDPWPEDRPRSDPFLSQDVLGKAQWAWLEQVLTTTEAEVTLIANGLQFIGRNDPWVAEVWSKQPESQAKLLALLAATNTTGALILSGDVHVAEVNRLACAGLGYPLYDLTSSGLTHSWGGRSFIGRAVAAVWRTIVVGHTRVDDMLFQRPHFGLVDFDWAETAVAPDSATGRCIPPAVPASQLPVDAPARRDAAACVVNDAERTRISFKVHGTRREDAGLQMQYDMTLASLRPAAGAGLQRLAAATAHCSDAPAVAAATAALNTSSAGPVSAQQFDAAARAYACAPQQLDLPGSVLAGFLRYPRLTSSDAFSPDDLAMPLADAVRACAQSHLDSGFSPACKRLMHTCGPKYALHHAAYYAAGHAAVLSALWTFVGSGFGFAAWTLFSKKAATLRGGRSFWAAVGAATLAAMFAFMRAVL